MTRQPYEDQGQEWSDDIIKLLLIFYAEINTP